MAEVIGYNRMNEESRKMLESSSSCLPAFLMMIEP
jgi:hypothetical protein